ncbi:MAG: redoxin domain-containing protein, partial [Thermoplasmata archaeon]|nr:redoxin domain-containing protein [Thermoplasmata archaeon]
MARTRSLIFLLIAAAIAFQLISIGAEGQMEVDVDPTREYMAPPPSGYIHRPILEFFTGLSCPSCMGSDINADSPEKAVHDSYLTAKGDASVPYTTIVFHELNGGGVDDLRTQESEDRMRYYQPGLSGTPDLEFDGGYIELGGFSTSTLPIDEPNIRTAVDDSQLRYNDKPLRVMDRLTWAFPYVFLEVDQIYEDGSFFVSGVVRYDGNAKLVGAPQLRGSLYVFMVEDSAPAYSTVYEHEVVNDAVFRGYAIEAETFQLNNREEYYFSATWDIPDATVPIKPQDVYAVAAVYDEGDTDSSRGTDGNLKAKSPRSVQSATSRSTAFDKANSEPTVSEITVDGNSVTVTMDDDVGIARAFLFYNTVAPNATVWESVELTITGEEVCDDDGVCLAYSDPMGSAEIDYGGGALYAQVLVYDDQAAQGSSEVFMLGNGTSDVAEKGGSIEINTTGFWLFLGIALVIGAPILYMFSKGRKGSFWKFLSMKGTVAIFIIIGLLISIFSLSSFASTDTDTVPDFTVKDTEGMTHTPETYSGKVLVIDIMSTDCSVCNKEMPDLVEVYRTIKDRYGEDVQFLSVSVGKDDTNSMLNAFQDEYGADWPIGQNVKFISTFDAPYIPKMVIVAPNGDIAYTHTGAIKQSDVLEAVDDAHSGDYTKQTISSSGASLFAIGALAAVFGAITFFSPCSFPLLPGYISYYISGDIDGKKRNPMKAGIFAALGLVVFFSIVGIMVALFGALVSKYLVLLMPIVGGILFFLGLSIILGYDSYIEKFMDLVKSPFQKLTYMIRGDRQTDE